MVYSLVSISFDSLQLRMQEKQTIKLSAIDPENILRMIFQHVIHVTILLTYQISFSYCF